MATFLARICPRVVSTPATRAVLDNETGDLAILHDVDAAVAGAARIAPGDGVVPRGAAALLQQAALNRKARIVEIEEWQHGANLLAIEQIGIDAVQSHRIAAPRVGVALAVGVIQVQHATLADHGVVVQGLLQAFPELHRQFVEGDVAGQQIIGADDRRVAADIAAADPALFEHGDIGEAVLLGEIIGGGEAVAAAADDHGVIRGFGFRIAPGRRPAAMAGHRVAKQGEERIVHRVPRLMALTFAEHGGRQPLWLVQ